jgi:hypothetical protein
MPGSTGQYLRGKLSEFKRRCIIARMEKHTKLIPQYRAKLDALHKLLEDIRNPEVRFLSLIILATGLFYQSPHYI